MNQEEADQDVVDEVSEEVDSRGRVMRSEILNKVSFTLIEQQRNLLSIILVRTNKFLTSLRMSSSSVMHVIA